MAGSDKHSKRSKSRRRRMDAVAWIMFAIGLSLVAISTYVMVNLSLRVPPEVAEGVKPVLYLGGVFTLTSIGAKAGALDALKSILGGSDDDT